MALKPVFDIDLQDKRCNCCGRMRDAFSFLETKSFLFPSGYLDTCTDCIAARLDEDDSWDSMDKICQILDIPFEPTRYEELRAHNNSADLLKAYNMIYMNDDYVNIDWSSYNEAYKELEERGALIDVVPMLGEEERRKLQEKWGYNYDEEALRYLENLYDGLILTQNINGALQGDQALKI